MPVEKYRKCEPLSASADTKSVDPLVNLDSKDTRHPSPLISVFFCLAFYTPFLNVAGNSPDFKAGVTALANILKIQRHDDYLVMLKVGVELCPWTYFK